MKSNVKFSEHPVSKSLIATITVVRNLKVKNERMPRLIQGLLYNAHDLPPQNQKDIEVEIHCGRSKMEGLKVVVRPSYSFTGDFSQYIGGVKNTWHSGFKEVDDRKREILAECTRALTGVHKLATQRDLKELKGLIEITVPKIDR
jgi:hypothetical protein